MMAIQHLMLAFWALLHVINEYALRLVSLYQVSFDVEAGTVMMVPSVDAPCSHPSLVARLLILLLL